MLMMEAWACNFCRHILSQEGSQPILRLEDSNLSDCRWRWQGQGWQAVRPGGGEVTAAIWGIAFTLMILPVGLLWLTYHTFPPLPGSSWPFPTLWMGLTIAAHLGIVLWILLNHYQIAPYLNWQWRRGRYGLGHWWERWWERHFSRWRRLQ
jgi:hypothetical protein